MVPIIAINFGWRWAFVFSPLLAVVVDYLLALDPAHTPRVDETEVVEGSSGLGDAAGNEGNPGPSRSASCSRTRLVWFYLYWLPKFFQQQVWAYARQVGTAAGDHLCGGGYWKHRRRLAFVCVDWPRHECVRSARRIAMLICACCAVPILTVTTTKNM